ncbi:hypothetical protein BX666DRAFT_1996577 [Dichotomocladium elegans]|nr:hypothetical protein BX666DRAFT_1996577 [Dichotomocladium elegans]
MPTTTLATATSVSFGRDDCYSSFRASQDGAIAKTSLTQQQSAAKTKNELSHGDGENTTAGENPEIDDGFTKKSDSGIYFAMILSEYLDRQAMVEDAHENQKQQKLLEPVTTTRMATVPETDAPSQPSVTHSPEVGLKHKIMPHNDGLTTTSTATTTATATTAALSAAEAQAKEVIASLPNLIWVPAHKHPEIAPSEFVHWIQQHGASATIQNTKVRRQRSKLSRSMSYDDLFENEKDSSTATGSSSGDEPPASPKDDGDLILGQKDGKGLR